VQKIAPQTLIQLIKSAVHFGHSVHCWNPKMFPYIYTEKNGLHIIDLVQTAKLLDQACKFVYEATLDDKIVLFVGTKAEAAPIVAEAALSCNSYYINYRWLGGMLTNWTTVESRIKRLKTLEQKEIEGIFDILSNKEASNLKKELEKLHYLFDGIKHMGRIPDVIVVVDQMVEMTAIQEASTLNIPIISILDTNCDPDLVDIPIPGNDDSTLSIRLILNKLAESIYSAQTKK
jgi:small subunit ribosomal protein S2